MRGNLKFLLLPVVGSMGLSPFPNCCEIPATSGCGAHGTLSFPELAIPWSEIIATSSCGEHGTISFPKLVIPLKWNSCYLWLWGAWGSHLPQIGHPPEVKSLLILGVESIGFSSSPNWPSLWNEIPANSVCGEHGAPGLCAVTLRQAESCQPYGSSNLSEGKISISSQRAATYVVFLLCPA